MPSTEPFPIRVCDENPQDFGGYLGAFHARGLFLPLETNARAAHLSGSVIDDPFLPSAHQSAGGTESPTGFWGSAICDPDGPGEVQRGAARVIGVRGKLTASLLHILPTAPQCKRALLLPALPALPALRAPVPTSHTAGRSVCLPHHRAVRPNTEILSLSNCDVVSRTLIEPVDAEFLRLVDHIASADFVLTASCHIAAIAAACHRPFCFWADGLEDPRLRWHDFAALIAVLPVIARDVDEGRSRYAADIRERIAIPSMLALLANARFIPRPDALVRILRHEAERAGTLDLAALIAEFERRAPHLARRADDENVRYDVGQDRSQLAHADAAGLHTEFDDSRAASTVLEAHLAREQHRAGGVFVETRRQIADTARRRHHRAADRVRWRDGTAARARHRPFARSDA